MQIRRDWNLRFDAEGYVAQAGGTLPRLLQRPDVRADWEAAIIDAAELLQPAAAWDAFGIREFRHERLILENGAKIGSGPVASVMAGASHLVAGVCTAGPLISARITEHQRNGKRLRAMFLDDLGSWAVDQVRQQLCRTIEADANARDWHASASLSPGESEWPVTEQTVIFSLLRSGTDAIGVTLTESLVMTPIKSLSLIVGTGPGPLGVEGASNCDFCTIRERCNHRKMRLAGAAA
jgi:hypothetical protein